jgi:NSS family neurotransmitter:Na+ symporter
VTTQENTQHTQWSSRSAFLMATIGAAVGLGNLWRFPYIAGENGGGAFVLVYLACLVLVAIPIVVAEMTIGRMGQRSPVNTISRLIPKHRSRLWMLIGWLSVFIPLIGLSYYSVVAGWALEYIVATADISRAVTDANGSSNMFNALLASPLRMLFLHTVFIAFAAFVVSRGVYKGIEVISRIMMPALGILLLILVFYSIFFADIAAGLHFLFAPDFSKLSVSVVVMALGQAFFSVAVGVGVMMTYGSYMPQKFSLAGSAAIIVTVDTLVAILAGIAIFPIVFAYGLDPAEGPGLIFVTLPIAFGQMPGGFIVGPAFFIMLFFAAFSTAIGMLEPAVSWITEKGWSRKRVTFGGAFVCWFVGIAAILSFNEWSDVRLLPWIQTVANKDIFNLLDYLVTSTLIPINGLMIALFSGWVLTHEKLEKELAFSSKLLFRCWYIAVRWLAPIAIGVILISSLLPSS